MKLLNESQRLKQLKCRGDDKNTTTRYDVPYGEPIYYQHLMSIIFYTDYSEVSYEFSSTFRKRINMKAMQI